MWRPLVVVLNLNILIWTRWRVIGRCRAPPAALGVPMDARVVNFCWHVMAARQCQLREKSFGQAPEANYMWLDVAQQSERIFGHRGPRRPLNIKYQG